MDKSTAKAIAEIAQRKLRIETLETRNSDSLDFHDLAVWAIQEALEAAYEAGKQATKAYAIKGRSGS